MYLCEASNIFLNFRWLLLQTLTDHSALYLYSTCYDQTFKKFLQVHIEQFNLTCGLHRFACVLVSIYYVRRNMGIQNFNNVKHVVYILNHRFIMICLLQPKNFLWRTLLMLICNVMKLKLTLQVSHTFSYWVHVCVKHSMDRHDG